MAQDPVDLFDPDTYVPGVPHERFAQLLGGRYLRLRRDGPRADFVAGTGA